MGYPYKCGYLRWHRIRDVSGPLASLVGFAHRAIHTSRLVHVDKTSTNFESPHLYGYPTSLICVLSRWSF